MLDMSQHLYESAIAATLLQTGLAGQVQEAVRLGVSLQDAPHQGGVPAEDQGCMKNWTWESLVNGIAILSNLHCMQPDISIAVTAQDGPRAP